MIDKYIEKGFLEDKKDGERSQKRQLLWWKEKIGHYRLSDVSTSLIAEYLDELSSGITVRGTKRSGATVNRYFAALSHVFTIAIKRWEWLDVSPLDRIEKEVESRGRVRFLTQEERSKLLESCKESHCPYLHSIVVLAISTGMRKNEIMRLKWEDVDLIKGRIVIHETKNGQRHSVPLVGYALETINNLNEGRKTISPLLFPSTDQSFDRPYDIRTAWENAVKRAGIENLRFHDLRHDRASTLAAGGASLAQIAEVLNHKTLQMVKRYSHLTEGNVAGVLERLDESVFGKAKGQSQS
jgi:integrase